MRTSRSRSNGTDLIKKIHLKIWPLASRLLSLKVIGTDTDRSATYNFLVTFHSSNGPISYRFAVFAVARCPSVSLSVCLSVRPSVCHFRVLYPDG